MHKLQLSLQKNALEKVLTTFVVNTRFFFCFVCSGVRKMKQNVWNLWIFHLNKELVFIFPHQEMFASLFFDVYNLWMEKFGNFVIFKLVWNLLSLTQQIWIMLNLISSALLIQNPHQSDLP
jgi:Na+/alanine symporter